jgi:UDPglucose--hexose-1-phosphate uridylyltransferase
MEAAHGRLHKRLHLKPDGRRLWLYGWRVHEGATGEELPPAPPPAPHARWHPLRSEWVVYAAHRQERTFKPPAEFCPLCPSAGNATPGEIPFRDFEIAVFENRFPSFSPLAPEPPPLPLRTGRALGACEVIVYSAEHSGSLASLPDERVRLLVEVWADRCRELLARPEVVFAMPFENRGEQVGVTLHHPHGQLYAFPFLPPVLKPMVDAFRQEAALERMMEHMGSAYEVEGDANVSSFVPPCARFPFELWIAPRRRVPGPWAFDAAEMASFATALRRSLARLDALFARPMPYIALLYAAPKGEEGHFHTHLQILPFLRAAERLKYLAGCEQGAGTFLADMLPETMVERLRAAGETP